MIALHTNILVRFFTRDDPAQFEKVCQIIRRANSSFFITDVVAAELVWVLAGSYGWSRETITAALRQLFTRTNTEFQDRSAFVRAVRAYESGADFADALIFENALSNGCHSVATFDRKMRTHFPESTFEP